MPLDNGFFKIGFLTLCIGGLLYVWGGASAPTESQGTRSSRTAPVLEHLGDADKEKLANASKVIDAALRAQMKKLAGRKVNLLTVGMSPSQLESATVRALGDLFTKVKILSISDIPNASELVAKWRTNSTNTPPELSKYLALGDLTLVQWLEPSDAGLMLHTWYVKKDAVKAKDVYPWGEGTLPQETIDKMHRVILDPELRIGG